MFGSNVVTVKILDQCTGFFSELDIYRDALLQRRGSGTRSYISW